ncbi:MAG: PH domain-containing protein [Clostridia bacterium]|nr:PH domain-containing protein [Clostridia bacterium]
MDNQLLWKDRKRPFCGLPLSFTRYSLTNTKLLCDFGILNTVQEEIWLYRIIDMTVTRSIFQRIFGVGTIHIFSGDKSTPQFSIISIKHPFEVKEALSRKVEEQRNMRRVKANEFLDTCVHDDIFPED